jgi:hypothetical protein
MVVDDDAVFDALFGGDDNGEEGAAVPRHTGAAMAFSAAAPSPLQAIAGGLVTGDSSVAQSHLRPPPPPCCRHRVSV